MFKKLAGLAVSGMAFPVKLVAYPVLAMVATAHGILAMLWATVTHIHRVALAPFAICTIVRMEEEKAIGNNKGIASFFGGLSGFILLCVSVMVFSHQQNHGGLSQIAGNKLALGLGVWVATNLFSVLYEGGQAYANWLMDTKPGQSVGISEAKVVAPQNHLTMFSKISERDKVSEEEAWTFLGEAVAIGKNGKMKLGDAENLIKMISARAPTSAVVH